MVNSRARFYLQIVMAIGTNPLVNSSVSVKAVHCVILAWV